MAINYSSSIGKVRSLISDIDESNLRFTDERLQGFLEMDEVGGNVLLAAAMAQTVTAGDQNLLLKVVVMQKGELETQGDRVSKELRAQAEDFRQQARTGAGTVASATSGLHRTKFRHYRAGW